MTHIWNEDKYGDITINQPEINIPNWKWCKFGGKKGHQVPSYVHRDNWSTRQYNTTKDVNARCVDCGGKIRKNRSTIKLSKAQLKADLRVKEEELRIIKEQELSDNKVIVDQEVEIEDIGVIVSEKDFIIEQLESEKKFLEDKLDEFDKANQALFNENHQLREEIEVLKKRNAHDAELNTEPVVTKKPNRGRGQQSTPTTRGKKRS